MRIRAVAVGLGDGAVVAGIAVHDDGAHAELLGAADLEPAEDAAVAHERDVAGERDAGGAQRGEVGARAVVAEDEGRGHAAVGGVAVEGWDAGGEAGGGVFGEDGFA